MEKLIKITKQWNDVHKNRRLFEAKLIMAAVFIVLGAIWIGVPDECADIMGLIFVITGFIYVVLAIKAKLKAEVLDREINQAGPGLDEELDKIINLARQAEPEKDDNFIEFTTFEYFGLKKTEARWVGYKEEKYFILVKFPEELIRIVKEKDFFIRKIAGRANKKIEGVRCRVKLEDETFEGATSPVMIARYENSGK
ncbi:MAG: hypothetical protein ACLFQV_12875 [Vulcanimicrobiota bacterium]